MSSLYVPFLDILEYFQVDGSVTSVPLVEVLSHVVYSLKHHCKDFLTKPVFY